MNQRIIDLADKAVENISSGPWNISDEFCEKFARLIVLKCAEIADTAEPFLASDLIKQHFGVEE